MDERTDTTTLIVVDDIPENLDLLRDMLKGKNYRVLSFPDGRTALADIKSITAGDLKNRIHHIRKGDQFQEMVTTLNTMVETLNSEISGIGKTAALLAEKENLPDDCRILVNALNQKIRTRFRL